MIFARPVLDDLGGVLSELLPQVVPDRRDGHTAVLRPDLAGDVEPGFEVESDALRGVVLGVALAERSRGDPQVAFRVLHDEHLFRPVGVGLQPLNLARAEELPGVVADQQRHVRLLFQVGFVVQPLLDDGPGHPEREFGVGPRLGAEPVVAVDGGL
jgi:hypothetical protein